jgi:DNA modification methylase
MPDAAPDTASLQIEWWPVEKPLPYARNARVCPEQAIAKVAGSIHEFGFKNPILVDAEGVIIAGHTRLLAAQRLELETVPVIVCADLSPAKVKALRLADNRTGEETTWDEELLAVEIGELLGLDIDLSLTGFDEGELAALLAEPTTGLVDADDAPEPPEDPVSQVGDLWLLGGHRLLCGNSTSAEDVQRLMDGKRAVLMATDPPYLVDYDGGNHPNTDANGGKWGNPAKEKHWDAYTDHESAVDFYRGFLTVATEHALTPAPAIYQWFGAMRADIVFEAWRAVGLLPHQLLIWKKTRTVLTHSHFMWDYEPMMYGWVEGKMPRRRPPADARAVWEIESKIDDGVSGVHPTQKPIETIRRPIDYHTKAGELIYEPFSGSGTALIAAEEMGRRCNAIELSPAFVDVAVLRWEAFTGAAATLDGDGRTFAAVAEERSE